MFRLTRIARLIILSYFKEGEQKEGGKQEPHWIKMIFTKILGHCRYDGKQKNTSRKKRDSQPWFCCSRQDLARVFEKKTKRKTSEYMLQVGTREREGEREREREREWERERGGGNGEHKLGQMWKATHIPHSQVFHLRTNLKRALCENRRRNTSPRCLNRWVWVWIVVKRQSWFYIIRIVEFVLLKCVKKVTLCRRITDCKDWDLNDMTSSKYHDYFISICDQRAIILSNKNQSYRKDLHSNKHLDFLVWAMCHSLKWRRRGLWPILQTATRGRSRCFKDDITDFLVHCNLIILNNEYMNVCWWTHVTELSFLHYGLH